MTVWSMECYKINESSSVQLNFDFRYTFPLHMVSCTGHLRAIHVRDKSPMVKFKLQSVAVVKTYIEEYVRFHFLALITLG